LTGVSLKFTRVECVLSVLFCLSGRVHGAEIIEENDSRYSRKLG
jgi:hypothetical protein